MKRFRPLSTALAAFLLVFTVAACDGLTDAATDDATGDVLSLAAEAALSGASPVTDAQIDAVRAAVDRHARRGPDAALWYVAAALQDTLTAEQKERLLARADEVRERRGDRPGPMRPGHDRPGQGQRPDSGQVGFRDLLADLLTEDQQAEVEDLRARYGEQIDALKAAFRNEEMDAETFREELQALHAAVREAIDALLTEDQRAALEARIAERRAEMEAELEARRAEMEAARAADREAMIDALGLDAEQTAALDALVAAQQEARETLREALRAGEIDHEGARAEFEALAEAHRTAVDALLDETQREIVAIHHALVVLGPRMADRQGGPNGDRQGGQNGGDRRGGGPNGGGRFGG